MRVDAVCLDFYKTLADHRTGRGRGAILMQYLEAQGLASDPWEHQVLSDVFEPHGREYSPDLAPEPRSEYLVRLVERLFRRLNVQGANADAATHALAIWHVLGPSSLVLYPEVPRVLRALRAAGIATAVVSNWQCGLSHFCTELGIGGMLDAVIASAEVGSAKPEPAIFEEACRRLEVTANRTLHVGDTVLDDLEGARRAGLQAVLVQRGPSVDPTIGPWVSDLDGILERLGLN